LLYVIEIKQKNQCFIFGTTVADCSSAEWGIPLVLALLFFCRTRLIEIKDQVSRTDIMSEINMPTTERSGRIGWTDGFGTLVVGGWMYRSGKSLTLNIKFIESEGENL